MEATKRPMIWKVRNFNLTFPKTLLMGILNLTPDSFSDGGRFCQPERAIHQAKRLMAEGADVLDIGAESSRPGAKSISAEEEISRLQPVLIPLAKEAEIPISIDTTKAEVAEFALKKGAHIINDISGLQDSGSSMAEVIKRYQAGIVLMHRRGNAETMQQMTQYHDVVEDVFRELKENFQRALKMGLEEDQIVLDPGVGFAKDKEQNLQLIANVERFYEFNRPVLIGASRKSFLGAITGHDIQNREDATTAIHSILAFRGIQILRVHEIKPALDAIRIAQALREGEHVRSF